MTSTEEQEALTRVQWMQARTRELAALVSRMNHKLAALQVRPKISAATLDNEEDLIVRGLLDATLISQRLVHQFDQILTDSHA